MTTKDKTAEPPNAPPSSDMPPVSAFQVFSDAEGVLPVRTATGRFIDEQQAEIMQGFAARFNEIFEDHTDTEISNLLDTARATIYPYRKGTRLPTAEILIKIGRAKRINLDWLLLGRGQKNASKGADIFSTEEEREIRKAAKRSGVTFEEKIRELALGALELGKRV